MRKITEEKWKVVIDVHTNEYNVVDENNFIVETFSFEEDAELVAMLPELFHRYSRLLKFFYEEYGMHEDVLFWEKLTGLDHKEHTDADGYPDFLAYLCKKKL